MLRGVEGDGQSQRKGDGEGSAGEEDELFPDLKVATTGCLADMGAKLTGVMGHGW